jgi:hypothetical protein
VATSSALTPKAASTNRRIKLDCVVCGAPEVQGQAIGMSAEARALYREHFGHEADMSKIGVCDTCASLPETEQRKSLYQTGVRVQAELVISTHLRVFHGSSKGQVRAALRSLRKLTWKEYEARMGNPPLQWFIPAALIDRFGASQQLRWMYMRMLEERVLTAIAIFGKNLKSEPKLLAAACAPPTGVEFAWISDWLLESCTLKRL